MSAFYPSKRRRTATSVFAGDFDPRPSRDVLTSVLNGVPINKSVEKDEEARRVRKEKRREKEKEKLKEKEKEKKAASKPRDKLAAVASTSQIASAPPAHTNKKPIAAPIPLPAVSTFWQTRPTIHIATHSRSVSVTPPPMMSSPSPTPGTSESSATSSTSSKRPYTPDDDEELTPRGRAHSRSTYSPQPSFAVERPPRKKRVAARKGWKGWVEGELQESEKLINLDQATVYTERKTRSGKSFDAISEGQETWV